MPPKKRLSAPGAGPSSASTTTPATHPAAKKQRGPAKAKPQLSDCEPGVLLSIRLQNFKAHSNFELEFGPHVLRWFFAAAHTTGRDAFVMGPSGFGYNVSLAAVCPSHLTTRSPDADRCCRQFPSLISPPQKQAEFAAATASAAEQLGWEGYCHWDLPHGAEDIRGYIKRLDGTAIKGVFATDVAGAFLPSRIGSVEVFTSHQLLDQHRELGHLGVRRLRPVG